MGPGGSFGHPTGCRDQSTASGRRRIAWRWAARRPAAGRSRARPGIQVGGELGPARSASRRRHPGGGALAVRAGAGCSASVSMLRPCCSTSRSAACNRLAVAARWPAARRPERRRFPCGSASRSAARGGARWGRGGSLGVPPESDRAWHSGRPRRAAASPVRGCSASRAAASTGWRWRLDGRRLDDLRLGIQVGGALTGRLGVQVRRASVRCGSAVQAVACTGWLWRPRWPAAGYSRWLGIQAGGGFGAVRLGRPGLRAARRAPAGAGRLMTCGSCSRFGYASRAAASKSAACTGRGPASRSAARCPAVRLGVRSVNAPAGAGRLIDLRLDAPGAARHPGRRHRGAGGSAYRLAASRAGAARRRAAASRAAASKRCAVGSVALRNPDRCPIRVRHPGRQRARSRCGSASRRWHPGRRRTGPVRLEHPGRRRAPWHRPGWRWRLDGLRLDGLRLAAPGAGGSACRSAAARGRCGSAMEVGGIEVGGGSPARWDPVAPGNPDRCPDRSTASRVGGVHRGGNRPALGDLMTWRRVAPALAARPRSAACTGWRWAARRPGRHHPAARGGTRWLLGNPTVSPPENSIQGGSVHGLALGGWMTCGWSFRARLGVQVGSSGLRPVRLGDAGRRHPGRQHQGVRGGDPVTQNLTGVWIGYGIEACGSASSAAASRQCAVGTRWLLGIRTGVWTGVRHPGRRRAPAGR